MPSADLDILESLAHKQGLQVHLRAVPFSPPRTAQQQLCALILRKPGLGPIFETAKVHNGDVLRAARELITRVSVPEQP